MEARPSDRPMLSLLLNIYPDDGQEARLETAIMLVKNQGGHISCIQVITLPLAVGDPASALTEAESLKAMEKVANKHKEQLEVRLYEAGVGWSWNRLYGDAAATIVRQSRLADMIVLSARDSYPPISSVTLHGRAPVLAVTQNSASLDTNGPALVAWNGSRPAATAMRAALPILGMMEPVQVLCVDKDSEEFPSARALEYLKHHAVLSEGHWRDSDDKPVADAIIAFAEQLGSGLIVAGAFGHNRIREMLLGSVTRSLLKTSPLPLLLAH